MFKVLLVLLGQKVTPELLVHRDLLVHRVLLVHKALLVLPD